jgi:hypothetical protein
MTSSGVSAAQTLSGRQLFYLKRTQLQESARQEDPFEYRPSGQDILQYEFYPWTNCQLCIRARGLNFFDTRRS